MRNNCCGQTMVEYALVLGVIATAVLLTLGILTGTVDDVLARLSELLA